MEAPFAELPDNFDKNLKTVKIELRQHIGQSAKPIVKVGDTIEKFRKIASCEGLGAEIHSTYDANVKEITENYIILEIKR